MPRSKILGFLACVISLLLGVCFFYNAFYDVSINISGLDNLSQYTYYSLAIPLAVVVLAILGTGMWIGWTILTIKVAPPMPEIVDKKDNAKFKAFLLCLSTLLLAAAFVYGVILRSYWALALPAAIITLVLLGMIFWVGLAIITTRSTLPEDKKS